MKKTRHLVIAIVAVAIVLGIGAVGAYAGMAGDATPPVTTSDVALSYTGDVAFSLNATDAEGVAYIYHRFDKGVARLFTVATDTVHPAVAIAAPTAADTPMSLGTHTVKFWAQDVNGNVEAQQTSTFTVNPALTLARSAAVVNAGRYFTLSGALKPADGRCRHPGQEAGRLRLQEPQHPYHRCGRRVLVPVWTVVKGTWSFRTYFMDNKTELSAMSATVKVRVK